jgi:hypothetical protein
MERASTRRDRINARLESLAPEGRLRPADVVEDARDPASPLHDEFEWDDALAAAEHRLARAETLIRAFRFEVIHTDTVTARIFVPRYIHSPDVKGREYTDILTVQPEEDRAALMALAELRQAVGAVARALVITTRMEAGVQDLVQVALRRLQQAVIRVEARLEEE